LLHLKKIKTKCHFGMLWADRIGPFDNTPVSCFTFRRDHEIRKSHEEKTVEVEERVEQVQRQGQKDLQETKTKHKKELAKVNLYLQMNHCFKFLVYQSQQKQKSHNESNAKFGQNHIVDCRRGNIKQALTSARESMQAPTLSAGKHANSTIIRLKT